MRKASKRTRPESDVKTDRRGRTNLPSPKTKRTKSTSVMLPITQVKKIKAIAELAGVSKEDVLNVILATYLVNEKSA